jgi:hypothetical protein
MHVDGDRVTEPLDGADDVQKTEDLKPDVEEKPAVLPDLHVIHENLVSSSAAAAGAVLPSWLKPEAQVMMQAEEIVKKDPQRRAAMAGVLCDLVGEDCSAMWAMLKVYRPFLACFFFGLRDLYLICACCFLVHG